MHFYPDADYLARPENIQYLWNLWGSVGSAALSRSMACRIALECEYLTRTQSGMAGHSRYTDIYINQRDMPFLVDSLRIVLNRRGLNIFTLQSNPSGCCATQGYFERLPVFPKVAEREALITIEVDLI